MGVLPDVKQLSVDQMQTIARQLNYSESTFVFDHSDTEAIVKIFLPVGEIPFAGHPTIGTAYILEKLYRQTHEPRSELVLKLAGGDVKTYFENDTGPDPGRVYMDQLPIHVKGIYDDDIHPLIEALDLSRSQLLSENFYMISPTELTFLFIPVNDPTVLKNMNPDQNKLKSLLSNTTLEPYVFTPSGIDGGDIHARFFAPNSGIPEDPATGSAQASLIKSMDLLEILPDTNEICVEQGYEMNRPSKLYNQILGTGENFEIRTGGKSAHIIKGQLLNY